MARKPTPLKWPMALVVVFGFLFLGTGVMSRRSALALSLLPRGAAHAATVEDLAFNASELPHYRWVVVIPLITRELDRVPERLQMWESRPPCNARATRSTTDLLLYYHKTNRTALENITRMITTASYGHCFRDVAFNDMFANLTEQEDAHPAGPNFMFYKLFEAGRLPDRYDMMLFIEQDAIPVRSNWLSRLQAAVRYKSEPFLVLGATSPVVNTERFSSFHHLNGNAVYNVRPFPRTRTPTRVGSAWIVIPTIFSIRVTILSHTRSLALSHTRTHTYVTCHTHGHTHALFTHARSQGGKSGTQKNGGTCQERL